MLRQASAFCGGLWSSGVSLVLLLGGDFLLAVGAAIAIGLLDWDTFAGGFLVVGVLLSFAAVACFYMALRKEVMGSKPVASSGEEVKNTPGPTNPEEPGS